MSGFYDDMLDPWGPSSGAANTSGVASGPDLTTSIRLCLDKTILPPVYAVAYSAALKAGSGVITRDVLQEVLKLSDLPRATTSQILLAADPGLGGVLSQRDFNLALAMVALAQKNVSPTLESVAFHKDDLPIPELSDLSSLSDKKSLSAPPTTEVGSAPIFASNSEDPWSNLDKAQPSKTPDVLSSQANPNDSNATSQVPGTVVSGVAAMTIASTAKEQNGSSHLIDTNGSTHSVPNISMEASQWKLDSDDASISEAAEKGGIVFKHTNYELSTKSFSAMVVRRYNDFFWVSGYLVKRYPYRMIPNIPPKGFPDNRIKGLTRFSNAILRVPFLRKDPVIIQFFTNTDEFSRIIKVGNLDTDQEEFDFSSEIGNASMDEVHQTFTEFDEFYKKVSMDEERCRTQITVLEKISRYKQAIGDELYAYSDTLRPLNAPAEATNGARKSNKKFKADRQMRENLSELSMNFGDSSLLEKAQGEVTKAISAENLRRMYDMIISMKLMMDRMRQMDNYKSISRLKDRNEVNNRALSQLTGSTTNGSGNGTPTGDRSSIEKLERLIKEDMSDLKQLENEQQCIEVCFYQETARYRCYESFLQTHYHRFVEEQIKHHTLALNAWKQALISADNLPNNPLDFIS